MTNSVLCAAPAKEAVTNNVTWTNNNTFPIFIYRGYVWCGVSKGCLGDISFTLSDPRYVYVATNDDHYEDRGGIPMNQLSFDCTPSYYILNPGESLTLALTSNADVNVPCVAQAFAFFNYVI